jgi:hypothetical protein
MNEPTCRSPLETDRYLRSLRLAAKGQSLARFGNPMRFAYVVHMLGVALYFVNYG